MQQDKHIQQKLQQLENQQLPDLSQMDEHWAGMQATLQPGIPVSKSITTMSKLLFALVGTITIIAAILFFQKDNKGERDLSVRTTSVTSKDQIAAKEDDLVDSANNSSVLPVNVNSLRLTPQLTVAPIFSKPYYLAGDTLTGDEFFKDSVTLDKKINDQLLLADLFKSLSKPAQHFSIDNRKDTVLVCKEGTIVMVPARTFAGEDSIDFEITEFYEYSDMVLNRLTTMSDTNQLISGGMLKINAYRNDSLIDVKLDKSLKVFVPGITEKDSMQIFEGKETEGNVFAESNLNWDLTSVKIKPGPRMTIYAIDLVDENFDTGNANRKAKGKFRRDRTSPLTRQELVKKMKERYPAYSKIVVKRNNAGGIRRFTKWLFNEKRQQVSLANSWVLSSIGSKAGFSPEYIKLHKLDPIDTSYSFSDDFIWQAAYTPATQFNWSQIKDKYNIDINKLGWINCDRFYNTRGRKTDYYVNTGNKASNYFTVIVFDKFKSIMSGSAGTGKNVAFSRLPVGASVKIISIGVNAEGKSVMAMKATTIKKNEIIQLDYEEQDKGQIKNSLSILNK